MFVRDGLHALRITPDAGAVKNRKTIEVPLHEHLIEQGFLNFVSRRTGPLFYEPAQKADEAADPTKPPKPRYVQARQRVADWIRSLGVDDPDVSPNHGWRHTFKQIGSRAGIERYMLDHIVGHAPANVGADYGPPTLSDKAKALEKFPRYVM